MALNTAMNMHAEDILAFNELLAGSRDDADRAKSSSSTAIVTPGSFGAPRASAETAARSEASGAAKKKKKDPKDIWDEDEVPPEEAILSEDLHDKRPRPRWVPQLRAVTKR